MIPGCKNSELLLLQSIIKKHFTDAEIIIFGSRVLENYKSTSDLDVCLKDNKALILSNWSMLEEAISASDIPYKVDLSDWHRLTPEFQALVLKSGINITKAINE